MKRIVLTGAGGGLGRAFAEQLAKDKPRMLLIDIDRAHTEETAELVRKAGGEAIVEVGDITDPELFVRAVALMKDRFGGTDMLINNAGVAGGGAVGEFPLSDWEWLLRINLFGAIYACHAFAPIFKEQKSGAILNVASCAGLLPMPLMAAYNVSKAGVVSLSETLAAEMRPFGVDVSVLCPTFFPTRLMQHFRSPTDRERKMAERAFAKSTMNAEGVAKAALRGLKNRELIIVPQVEGAAFYRLKRLWPQGFAFFTGNKKAQGALFALLGLKR